MNNFIFKTVVNSIRQQKASVILKSTYSGSENEKFSSPVVNIPTQQAAAATEGSQFLEKIESNQMGEKVGYLNSKSIHFNYGWNNLNLSVCKQSGNDFFLNSTNGDFHCLKCNRNGDWKEFKSLTNVFNENIDCEFSSVKLFSANIFQVVTNRSRKNTPYIDLWEKSKPLKNLDDAQYKVLIRNSSLETDLSKQVLEQHDIRIVSTKTLFPVYDDNGDIVEIALLNSNDKEELELNEELIYGLNSLKSDCKTLFITDTIKNMLALNEKLKKPAIVANSSSCLSTKLLAQLEKYDSIIIWQKNSQLSLKLAQALNHTRCYLINYSRNPFESMRLKENISKIIEKEKFSLKNNTIIRFGDLREGVYDQLINAKKYAGVKWRRFQILNDIMKGHRAGELTIFTGPTGSGKTTFLSEYSLDLTMQGVRTLWGSFEIQNNRLAKLMMTQFSGLNLHKNVNLFDSIAGQFSQLPIYFMNFHGQETMENVLKTMSNAVILHDVKHIIIDNLQFMVGTQFPNSFDKYNQQDQILASFRRFATNFNCHVTIVIHPKKEESDEFLKISSIFGSAKSTQEADNVLILQERKASKDDKNSSSSKFIEICKNRYDGELGKMVIKFDKERLCFVTRKTYREEDAKRWDLVTTQVVNKANKRGAVGGGGENVFRITPQNDVTNIQNDIEITDNIDLLYPP